MNGTLDRPLALVALAGAVATGLAAPAEAVTIRSGAAANIAGLADIVNTFRADLGDLNRPDPGSAGEGRREINWDGAPDGVSAPNEFPGDFFNGGAFPRARGVIFTTPGTGLQLSATVESGVGIEFSNIEESYLETFEIFSAERLFTAIDSNVVDVIFKVPGVDHDGLSTGFGAVFTDVDEEDVTSLEFYDKWGNSLGLWYVPSGAPYGDDESLSFLGVKFDEAIVARVRITNGNAALEVGVVDEPGVDLVVMDDFIFGEPVPAAPVPGDATGDGLVNVEDILVILVAWGPCQDCPEDLDGDGYVAFSDLLIVLANFD